MPTPDQQQFFLRFGKRVRRLRKERRHSQEDMISYGFSARHWQQIETGRPITVSTLLRICAVFEISVESLVRGLAGGSDIDGFLIGHASVDPATFKALVTALT